MIAQNNGKRKLKLGDMVIPLDGEGNWQGEPVPIVEVHERDGVEWYQIEGTSTCYPAERLERPDLSAARRAGEAIANAQFKDRTTIPYRPEYNLITGSVEASILLQQIHYWWMKMDRRPFFKFKEPCEHDAYQEGDSWTEELGFTRYQFDKAIKAIGTKVTQGDSKTEVRRNSLVVCWTDWNRMTWYELNEEQFFILVGIAYTRPELLDGPKVDPRLYLKLTLDFTKSGPSTLPSFRRSPQETTTIDQHQGDDEDGGEGNSTNTESQGDSGGDGVSGYRVLRDIGVKKQKAQDLADAHDDERILAAVDVAGDNATTNKAGYAISLLEDEEWEPPEEEESEPIITTVRVNEDKIEDDTDEVVRNNGHVDGMEEAVSLGWRYTKARSVDDFEGWVYKLPGDRWVPWWVFELENEKGEHARQLLKEDGCQIRIKG